MANLNDGNKKTIPERFIDENLAAHWQVDETQTSFDRLLYHLEVKTNVKPYFEEALRNLNLDDDKFANELIIADIGAGTCWTSAILAKHPKVKVVYAVDPSENRLRHGSFVVKHFGVENKVKIINGTFLDPNVPEKVDLIVLCGSFHHCYDKDMEGLFANIKRLLKPNGRVLIVGEHYVNWTWAAKRALIYLKWRFKQLFRCRDKTERRSFFYSLNNLYAPDPFGGEHWRTRKKIEKIFKTCGFTAQFFIHDGDLCKDKHSFYQRMGWYYYFAILQLKH